MHVPVIFFSSPLLADLDVYVHTHNAELGEGRASGSAAPGGRLQVAAKWVHHEYVK